MAKNIIGTLYDDNGIPVATAATGDGLSTYTSLNVGNQVWNGSVYERQASNQALTLVTATAATTTQTGTDQVNATGRGVTVVLNMATVGTGSVTITIQGKDVASGQYYTLLAGAAVTTNSVNVYTVYPGAPATANVSANALLPRVWRVLVTANNANPATYTVGASVTL